MKDILIWFRQFFMPRRRWYRLHYLQSNHWKEFRTWRKQQEGYLCQGCGKAEWPLDVHHLPAGYFFLWLEQFVPFLTVVLCRDCHEAEHAND